MTFTIAYPRLYGRLSGVRGDSILQKSDRDWTRTPLATKTNLRCQRYINGHFRFSIFLLIRPLIRSSDRKIVLEVPDTLYKEYDTVSGHRLIS